MNVHGQKKGLNKILLKAVILFLFGPTHMDQNRPARSSRLGRSEFGRTDRFKQGKDDRFKNGANA